jgi:hypothetical protein
MDSRADLCEALRSDRRRHFCVEGARRGCVPESRHVACRQAFGRSRRQSQTPIRSRRRRGITAKLDCASFASRSTKPRQGRSGSAKSNSTAFAWPPVSIAAPFACSRETGSTGATNIRAIAALTNIKASPAYLDGELCGIDAFGPPSFACTEAASDGERGAHLVYYAFDLMHLDGGDISELPLLECKAMLERLIPAAPACSSTATSSATASFFVRMRQARLRGHDLKDRRHPLYSRTLRALAKGKMAGRHLEPR